jgi:hypothetical protein
MDKDYFSLMEFSAKWDPISSSCMPKSYSNVGFMGQTTSFNANLIKSNVLVMGTCELNGEAHIFTAKRKRNVYFYGGHDPEDYQHQVGDLLFLIYILIPGYRLILNNVLSAAKRRN